MIDIAGKVVLVTGASGGLGSHFARSLAASGAAVALAARRMHVLEERVAELRQTGARAVAVLLDVTDQRSVAEAVASVGRDLGSIDVLVNNSGVSAEHAVLAWPAEDWDRVLDTNLRGAFLVAQAVGRSMQEADRGGSIINIASILGIRQAGHVAAYAASKAGLIQLTRTMALELARFGIRVNAIAPGYFATELNTEFRNTPAGDALVKRIPQRRLGRPDDLDGVLHLLASDASRYITGAVIPVDGGHLVSTL
jgi:NAD(P)-dependent dehydrogenase (short-subunit alcohol dehydrogenase family)